MNQSLTKLNLDNSSFGGHPDALEILFSCEAALRSLSLGGNGLTSQCLSALRFNSTLTSLNLENNKLGHDISPLSAALTFNSALTRLNLDDNGLGAAGVQLLAEGLASNSTLKRLDLEWNDMSHEGARHLHDLLLVNSTLTTLKLGSNDVGDVGAHAIFSGAHNHPSLTCLNLASNFISHVGLEGLDKWGNRLAELDLSFNELNTSGAAILSRCLDCSSSLVDLRLDDTALGEEGCSMIVRSLSINSSLTFLALNSNEMGDEVFQQLVVQSQARNLTGLHLNLNNLCASSADAVHSLLSNNYRLEELDLGNNFFGDEGLKKIADALAGNTTLLTLNLEANDVSEEGLLSLATALRSNHTLQHLNLDSNSYSMDDCMDFFVQVFPFTDSLVSLVVGFQDPDEQKFSDDEDAMISSLLLSNGSLISLRMASFDLTSHGIQSLLTRNFHNQKMKACSLLTMLFPFFFYLIDSCHSAPNKRARFR